MRFNEFNTLSEGAKPFLVGDELFKKKTPMRTEIFLNRMQSKNPEFTHRTLGPVIVPPELTYQENNEEKTISNIDIFLKYAKAGNPNAVIQLLGYKKGDKAKNPVPINIKKTSGDLEKDAEFGGSKFVSGGKEAAELKPADIGINPTLAYSPNSLLKAIVNNQKLQSTNTGQKVIEAAQLIAKGQNTFALGDLSPGEFRAFRDDAGEYLGPLAMFYGLASFKGGVQDAFFNHVGLSSLKEMKMIFPAEKNSKLADAHGVVAGFVNPKSNNKVWVSIKAGKSGQGAAFAIGDFAIPKELKEKNPKACEFLELQAKTTTKNSAFVNANWLRKIKGSVVSKYLTKEIPINEMNNAAGGLGLGPVLSKAYNLMKKGEVVQFLDDTDDLLQEYKNVFYALESLVIKDINKGGMLPNLAPVVRETLQQNFIKLSNKMAPQNQAEQNTFVSEITWPNRELGTGQVKLATKNSMAQMPSSRLSMMVN